MRDVGRRIWGLKAKEYFEIFLGFGFGVQGLGFKG